MLNFSLADNVIAHTGLKNSVPSIRDVASSNSILTNPVEYKKAPVSKEQTGTSLCTIQRLFYNC